MPKLKNPMFDLGKNIIQTLDEKKNFLESEIVIIENQPALKNPTMKSVQMIVYSYFLMKGSIKDIQMINARNKLKAYEGPKVECNIKETYKRNKYLAIQYTRYMMYQNPKISNDYHKLFEESKKERMIYQIVIYKVYILLI